MRKVKKVQDVALLNYKEDMDLTMDGLKGNLNREIKNVRRELIKTKLPPRPDFANKKNEPTVEKTPENVPENPEGEEKKVIRKPQKRRYYNKKKSTNKPGSSEASGIA